MKKYIVLIILLAFMVGCATAPIKPSNSAEALILAEAALTEANVSFNTIVEQAVFYKDAGVLEQADGTVKTLMSVDAILAVAEQSGSIMEEAKSNIMAARAEGQALAITDVAPYSQKRHEAEDKGAELMTAFIGDSQSDMTSIFADAKKQLNDAGDSLDIAHTTLDISTMTDVTDMSIPAIRKVIRQAAVTMVRHSQGD